VNSFFRQQAPCDSRAEGRAKTSRMGASEQRQLRKAGSFPVGDDSRGQLLPIRDRPSVITTVADHPMKGRISKLRAWSECQERQAVWKGRSYKV